MQVTAYVSWCEEVPPQGGESGSWPQAAFDVAALRVSLHSRGLANMKGALRYCSHCGTLRITATGVAESETAATPFPPAPKLILGAEWRVTGAARLPTPCAFGGASVAIPSPRVSRVSVGSPARGVATAVVPCHGSSPVTASSDVPPAAPITPALSPLPLMTATGRVTPPSPLSADADTDSDNEAEGPAAQAACKRPRTKE